MGRHAATTDNRLDRHDPIIDYIIDVHNRYDWMPVDEYYRAAVEMRDIDAYVDLATTIAARPDMAHLGIHVDRWGDTPGATGYAWCSVVRYDHTAMPVDSHHYQVSFGLNDDGTGDYYVMMTDEMGEPLDIANIDNRSVCPFTIAHHVTRMVTAIRDNPSAVITPDTFDN